MALMSSILLLNAQNASPETIDEVAVVINDDVILRSELIDLIEPYKQAYLSETGRQTIDETFLTQARMLVEEAIAGRLLVHEARKQGVEVEASRVDEAIKQDQEKAGSEEEFLKTLAENGETPATWREKRTEALLVDRLTMLKLRGLRQEVTISEQDVQNHYEERREEFSAESGEPRSIAEVRDEIEMRLRAQRVREKFNEWLAELRDNAKMDRYFRWSDILE
jgi:peptidyl-prolyl cis-trans isomerase SurA